MTDPYRHVTGYPDMLSCKECGSVVVNRPTHDAWHADLNRPASSAERDQLVWLPCDQLAAHDSHSYVGLHGSRLWCEQAKPTPGPGVDEGQGSDPSQVPTLKPEAPAAPSSSPDAEPTRDRPVFPSPPTHVTPMEAIMAAPGPAMDAAPDVGPDTPWCRHCTGTKFHAFGCITMTGGYRAGYEDARREVSSAETTELRRDLKEAAIVIRAALNAEYNWPVKADEWLLRVMGESGPSQGATE